MIENNIPRWKDRQVLIYGATGGIGQALCQAFHKQGAHLYLIGRSKSKLDQLREELGGEHQCFLVDHLTSKSSYEQLLNQLREQGGRFEVGIHAVGRGVMKRISQISLEEWQSTMDVNLHSAFAFSKLFLELTSSKQFELVFLGSASTEQSWPKNALYGAGKAGLEYFVNVLQQEIRPSGGRAWLYRAGAVNTDFFQQIKNHLPPHKMIQPDELADIIIENFRINPKIYSTVIPLRSE